MDFLDFGRGNFCFTTPPTHILDRLGCVRGGRGQAEVPDTLEGSWGEALKFFLVRLCYWYIISR